MTDKELLARIGRSAGQKAGYKQLVRELGLGGGRERRLLLEQLTRLAARGLLTKLDRELWSLPRAAKNRENLVAGRLDLHRDGFGFVRPNQRQSAGDIFIPPNALGGAMQGDQVLVEVGPPDRDGRLAGMIVRVLERKNPTVVGLFHYARSRRATGNLVVPFDDRMSQPILIPDGLEQPAADMAAHRVLGAEALRQLAADDLEGLVVDVEITSWPTPTRPAIGKVIEIVGHPDDFGVDVEMVIRKHQLPRVFPEQVLAEARAVATIDPAEVERRRDFRALPIVTIDGETARDFDDAVLVTARSDGGYELQVHIADVTEYVRPETALDLEARLRGTSVYFPDRAIPMLPHELSTGICSLRPHEDRLVLSCIMQLDATGRIEGYEIVSGVICSAARMTYTEVHKILDGDQELRTRYAALVPGFERMHELAMKMNRLRSDRGSIDFDLPEPVIEFDENGEMRGVTKAERTWANRLIEEFMLAANECVASWIDASGVAGIYRVHEQPDSRRVAQFEEQAIAFGYTLGVGALPVRKIETRGDRRDSRRSGRDTRKHEVVEEIPVTPRMYQKLAARIEGKPEERILSYLMLRSLRQARYSEHNQGHFALAAPNYTHFTSPIRRYPDLTLHRILKTLLDDGIIARGERSKEKPYSPWRATQDVASHHVGTGVTIEQPEQLDGWRQRPPIDELEIAQIADESSQAERRAAEAERELVEWKKVRFMQDRVGEDFDALVLNPSKYGMFVELTDMFVEGLVPIDSLVDDRYSYRENTHEIAGLRWGRVFRAGDRVRVVLDRILADERKLQFSLVEEDQRPQRKLAPGKSSPGKKAAKALKAERKKALPEQKARARKKSQPKSARRKR